MRSIWLWVLPSGEVQVYLWMFWWGNVALLTTRFFNVAKLRSLTPLSLLSWWRLSCPIVGLMRCLRYLILHINVECLFGLKWSAMNCRQSIMARWNILKKLLKSRQHKTALNLSNLQVNILSIHTLLYNLLVEKLLHVRAHTRFSV